MGSKGRRGRADCDNSTCTLDPGPRSIHTWGCRASLLSARPQVLLAMTGPLTPSSRAGSFLEENSIPNHACRPPRFDRVAGQTEAANEQVPSPRAPRIIMTMTLSLSMSRLNFQGVHLVLFVCNAMNDNSTRLDTRLRHELTELVPGCQ